MKRYAHVPFGSLIIRCVNKETGLVVCEQRAANMVIYTGIDLLGKLLSGQAVSPNVAYMEYQNGGVIPTVTPDPADGRAYYAALEASGLIQDYIRTSLIGTPMLSTTDATKFATNKVTFFAMSTAMTAGKGGRAFSAAAGSVVYGLALAYAADADDASQDVVFARTYNFTPITKQVNEEISITWSHEFGDEIVTSSSL